MTSLPLRPVAGPPFKGRSAGGDDDTRSGPTRTKNTFLTKTGAARHALVVAVYALAVWLAYRPLGLVDQSHIATCVCGDSAQQAWLLALWHAQLVGGHLSFSTRAVDFPGGVNLLENAAFPLLGVLWAPVTALFGPIGALALLFRFSVLVSAVTFYAVLRRLDLSTFAATVGGGFYAFSPFAGMEGGSHPFLVFTPIPPLILLIVYRRFLGIGRPFAGGLFVGALAVAQAMIDSETLITTVFLTVLSAAAMGVVAAVRRQPLRAHLRTAGLLAAGTAAVAGPLLAYPAWYAFAGPHHVIGRLSPPSVGISPAATLLPVSSTVVAGLWSAWRVAAVPLQHNTGFLGLVLLSVLAWVAVKGRPDPRVRALVWFGVLAWMAALGDRLVLGGSVTSVPLPYALAAHLPVLRDVVVKRFTFEVDLAAAGLLAIGIDRLRAAAGRGCLPYRAAVVGWVAAGLVLALPAGADASVSLGAAGEPLGRIIPNGAVVLAYPVPSYADEAAMVLQAEDGMRFDLLGGYAIHPGPDGRQAYDPTPLEPVVVWRFFEHPHPGRAVGRLLPAYVEAHRVTAALVDSTSAGAAAVVTLLQRIYGRPERDGDLDVWPDLHRVER